MKIVKIYKSGKRVFEIGGVRLEPANDELVVAVDVTDLNQEEIDNLDSKDLVKMV